MKISSKNLTIYVFYTLKWHLILFTCDMCILLFFDGVNLTTHNFQMELFNFKVSEVLCTDSSSEDEDGDKNRYRPAIR